MVEGCAGWQCDGLRPPELVTALTNAWRDESNPVRQFFDECCMRVPAARIKSAALYAAYCKWRLGEGIEAMNNKLFGRRLGALGFVAERTNREGRLWRGIDLDHRMST